MKRWVMAMMVVLLAGCAGINLPHFGSVADKYRQALANVDAFCKRYKMGPYLDRNNPESWRNAAATDCEILKVKPYDHAAVLATAEGKFAYSIQLPPPLDKPRVRRSDFRSAGAYFQALCEKEQGDYVFETRENVAGIAQLRLQREKPMLDKLGSFSNEFAGTELLAWYLNPPGRLVTRDSRAYKFMEIVTSFAADGSPQSITRYVQDAEASSPVALQVRKANQFKARYGYLWRGTPQLDSREEGISGGELILLEINTKKVLAVRRIFFRDDVNLGVTDRVDWSSSRCESIKLGGSRFLASVLRPAATEK